MEREKITVPQLLARKRRGPKIVALTAYDATLAALLDEGGADVLLVGDSLGMVVQGRPNTLPVTLEEMAYHTRAVACVARRAHVVTDMPFLSYQAASDDAIRNAGSLLQNGAEAVKLEGGEPIAPIVRRLVDIGIPVMGHLGLTPQSVHAMGGFKVQGRTEAQAERMRRDAAALVDAGVYAIVAEGIPAELARQLTANVPVPTIGIGAGVGCDGQVLVCYDFLGMVRTLRPKFVKRYLELGDEIVGATRRFVSEVRDGVFPGEEHSFSREPRSAAKSDES